MSNIPPNTPTIPIKQVTAKKFIPLVVGTPNCELKIPAKLFDDQKIQNFIQDILQHFEVIKDKNPALYAIRLSSSNQYINEKNRFELLSLNGITKFHDVDLCFNLETEVKTYVDKIASLKLNNPEGLIKELISIEKYVSSDKIFAYEFYAKGGKKLIVDYLKECERSNESKKWNLFYHLYKVLILFIKNWSLFTWESSEIELQLLKLICDVLNDSTKDNKKSTIPDYLVLLFLQIVNDVIFNNTTARELVFRELKFNEIIFLIQRQEIQIKETLLIFLNSCFHKGDASFRKNLNSILSQPLMNAVIREDLRLLSNLDLDNYSILDASDDSIQSENLSFDHRHKFGSLIATLNEKSTKKIKKFFKKRLSINNVDQTIYYDNASVDDRNYQKIFSNFAQLQKNILDIDYQTKIKIIVDKNHMYKIRNICNSAFEQASLNSSEKLLTEEEKLAKLGFKNISNPIDDFKETPPGMLALDFMEFFANKDSFKSVFQSFVSDKFNKNSEYMFPFVKASFNMVKYMYDLLNIGKDKFEEQYEILFIMFTISPDGIMDFLSRILWLFHRLWVEMKAQSLDFDRALSALKDSLFLILNDVNKIDKNNSNGYSSIIKRKLNDFNNLISTWKYDSIKKAKSRFDKSNLEPIKELEKILTDEVILMLRPKRLSVLCKGEMFEKINLKEKKSRQKQIWKLSSDYKTFNISDCDNIESNEFRNTTHLDVDRIKEVKKEDPRKQVYILHIICYRLDEQGEEAISLCSQNEEIIDVWLDGLKMLLNPSPTANITCFVECLKDVQLLDIYTLGIEIPLNIPKIPELPTNFEFNIVSNN
ncbi:unnamed protein product [Brachionus calyciflorus]|uniref:ELMO domain-containing protein n=1 Tax=Brachionus calyciflorus TaxID=104777 RepID=A0A813M401_9BILA|nr:unnamed protein product [Brachionus calyciflorus]